MSGFIMVDVDDFNEVWSRKSNHGLFIVYAALMERAWRQNKSKHVQKHQNRVTLSRNQFILNIRTLSFQTDLPESTLRDRLKKLETMRVIRKEKSVSGISIITILWAYNYVDPNGRTPRMFRAPSVGDSRTGCDYIANDPPQEPYIDNPNNDLKRSNTEDYRLEDSENQSKLVRRESSKDIDETDANCEIDDEDFPSDAEINMQINEICDVNPELNPGQVEEWAKSNQPIESILGHLK